MARRVKISSKMARLLFNGCDPDYIRDVCHASCCDSKTHPLGCVVTIHPSEQPEIELLGGVVRDGLLLPRSGEKRCPFKQADNLCGIHFSGHKPLGCIASPFTLNRNDTLIVRNRYRLLKCYNDGRKQPAYIAFRASLDMLFGADEAQRICDHLDGGGGDLYATIDKDTYRMLHDNDEIKHKATKRKDSRAIKDHAWQAEHLARPQAKIRTENRLTWVAGTRERSQLDETSRKNLSAGRKVAPGGSRQEAATLDPVTGKFERGDLHLGVDVEEGSGTSIFDPVLCELAYSWFTAPGALVLDPFAGGSVRGLVAAYLGRQYVGVDLRAEQIGANEAQARAIAPDNPPRWIVGNSLTDLPDEEVDFVFSCPPYYDLEIYSEQPGDLSALATYGEFLEEYRQIVAQCVARLRPDRFACFVVGDIRDDKAGIYRNFVSDTIAAFQDAGAMLYNEAILVTAVGSLPIRAAKQFTSSRKLGKTHQNVLVFVKGDPRKATQWCGPVEVGDLEGAYQVAAGGNA